jgi:hypothetical protein
MMRVKLGRMASTPSAKRSSSPIRAERASTRARGAPSLLDPLRSIPVSRGTPPRRFLSFVGPGCLAALDGAAALKFALVACASILILAASTFHAARRADVAEIGRAHEPPRPLLGAAVAPAPPRARLSSTVTATLAGQIVMEGFPEIRLVAMADRRDAALRRSGDGAASDFAQGGPEPAAAVRRRAAHPVRRLASEDGLSARPSGRPGSRRWSRFS